LKYLPKSEVVHLTAINSIKIAGFQKN